MADDGRQYGAEVLGVACMLALFVSGLVLATSFMVPWPGPILGAAAVVGLATLVAVVVVAYRGRRRSGGSLVGAAVEAGKDGLRFLRDFL